jgi:hypothetical protein
VDDERARVRRRVAARRRAEGRRRLALLVIGVLLLVVVLVTVLGGGDEERRTPARDTPKAPAALPRGGRSVLPERRVVAFYGAPQSRELGALGIGTPEQATRRLERQARAYARPGRPVLPALELIAAVASGGPGDDGLYRTRQDAVTIRRYLAAARRARALLLLDVQPGHAQFLDEVHALEPYLREPDVGLALDPEWRVGAGQVPGRDLGSMDAAEVNAITAYLAEIVRSRRLPEKLLVVHQFTAGMVRDKQALRARPGVATVLDVDGFGTAADKISKYHELTRGAPGFAHGIKLFYEEDTGLLRPDDVLRLRPQPEVVIYE